MTNIELSFRAQSLDSQSPDPVQINDRRLPEEDVVKRQELTKKISKVSLEGTQVFSEGLHNAFLHGDKFLLETPSEQLDVGDVNAPIICYGSVPDQPEVSWSRDVVTALIGFAKSIGWAVSPKNQEIAGRGVDAILEEAQKKSKFPAMGKMLWGAAALLIAAVWHLVKTTIKITQLRKHRRKVLRVAGVAGIAVIVLAVFGVIYKIFFKG